MPADPKIKLTPELDKEIQAAYKACYWRILMDQSVYNLPVDIYVKCWMAAAREFHKQKVKP